MPKFWLFSTEQPQNFKCLLAFLFLNLINLFYWHSNLLEQFFISLIIWSFMRYIILVPPCTEIQLQISPSFVFWLISQNVITFTSFVQFFLFGKFCRYQIFRLKVKFCSKLIPKYSRTYSTSPVSHNFSVPVYCN